MHAVPPGLASLPAHRRSNVYQWTGTSAAAVPPPCLPTAFEVSASVEAEAEAEAEAGLAKQPSDEDEDQSSSACSSVLWTTSALDLLAPRSVPLAAARSHVGARSGVGSPPHPRRSLRSDTDDQGGGVLPLTPTTSAFVPAPDSAYASRPACQPISARTHVPSLPQDYRPTWDEPQRGFIPTLAPAHFSSQSQACFEQVPEAPASRTPPAGNLLHAYFQLGSSGPLQSPQGAEDEDDTRPVDSSQPALPPSAEEVSSAGDGSFATAQRLSSPDSKESESDQVRVANLSHTVGGQSLRTGTQSPLTRLDAQDAQPQQHADCSQCLERETDLADVHVSGQHHWARVSDQDFLDALHVEAEIQARHSSSTDAAHSQHAPQYKLLAGGKVVVYRVAPSFALTEERLSQHCRMVSSRSLAHLAYADTQPRWQLDAQNTNRWDMLVLPGRGGAISPSHPPAHQEQVSVGTMEDTDLCSSGTHMRETTAVEHSTGHGYSPSHHSVLSGRGLPSPASGPVDIQVTPETDPATQFSPAPPSPSNASCISQDLPAQSNGTSTARSSGLSPITPRLNWGESPPRRPDKMRAEQNDIQHIQPATRTGSRHDSDGPPSSYTTSSQPLGQKTSSREEREWTHISSLRQRRSLAPPFDVDDSAMLEVMGAFGSGKWHGKSDTDSASTATDPPRANGHAGAGRVAAQMPRVVPAAQPLGEMTFMRDRPNFSSSYTTPDPSNDDVLGDHYTALPILPQGASARGRALRPSQSCSQLSTVSEVDSRPSTDASTPAPRQHLAQNPSSSSSLAGSRTHTPRDSFGSAGHYSGVRPLSQAHLPSILHPLPERQPRLLRPVRSYGDFRQEEQAELGVEVTSPMAAPLPYEGLSYTGLAPLSTTDFPRALPLREQSSDHYAKPQGIGRPRGHSLSDLHPNAGIASARLATFTAREGNRGVASMSYHDAEESRDIQADAARQQHGSVPLQPRRKLRSVPSASALALGQMGRGEVMDASVWRDLRAMPSPREAGLQRPVALATPTQPTRPGPTAEIKPRPSSKGLLTGQAPAPLAGGGFAGPVNTASQVFYQNCETDDPRLASCQTWTQFGPESRRAPPPPQGPDTIPNVRLHGRQSMQELRGYGDWTPHDTRQRFVASDRRDVAPNPHSSAALQRLLDQHEQEPLTPLELSVWASNFLAEFSYAADPSPTPIPWTNSQDNAMEVLEHEEGLGEDQYGGTYLQGTVYANPDRPFPKTDLHCEPLDSAIGRTTGHANSHSGLVSALPCGMETHNCHLPDDSDAPTQDTTYAFSELTEDRQDQVAGVRMYDPGATPANAQSFTCPSSSTTGERSFPTVNPSSTPPTSRAESHPSPSAVTFQIPSPTRQASSVPHGPSKRQSKRSLRSFASADKLRALARSATHNKTPSPSVASTPMANPSPHRNPHNVLLPSESKIRPCSDPTAVHHAHPIELRPASTHNDLVAGIHHTGKTDSVPTPALKTKRSILGAFFRKRPKG